MKKRRKKKHDLKRVCHLNMFLLTIDLPRFRAICSFLIGSFGSRGRPHLHTKPWRDYIISKNRFCDVTMSNFLAPDWSILNTWYHPCNLIDQWLHFPYLLLLLSSITSQTIDRSQKLFTPSLSNDRQELCFHTTKSIRGDGWPNFSLVTLTLGLVILTLLQCYFLSRINSSPKTIDFC